MLEGDNIEGDDLYSEDVERVIEESKGWVVGDDNVSKFLRPLDSLLRNYGFAMSQGREIIYSGDNGRSFRSITGYFEREKGESVKYTIEVSLCSTAVDFELWDRDMNLTYRKYIEKRGTIKPNGMELVNTIESDIRPALEEFL